MTEREKRLEMIRELHRCNYEMTVLTGSMQHRALSDMEWLLAEIERLEQDIELMKPYVPLPSTFMGSIPDLLGKDEDR